MLEIKNFSKSYGDKKVVDNLSISVQPGDIYGFIGANGAGKTTTIKSIVGIHTFDHGEVKLFNINLKDNPEYYKSFIGYSPDTPDLYNNMTGKAYIELIAALYKMENIELEEKLSYLIKELKFESAIYDLVSSYSHGMKQRLVLISLLMHDPKLIILDEPFVGLDPNAIDFLVNEIRRRASEGAIILYSTHVLEVAEKLCNKLVILDHGKAVVNDTMESILKKAPLNEIFKDVTSDE